MRIVKSPEDFELSLHFFKHSILSDFFLIEDFNSHLMASLIVEGHFNFAKRAVTQVLGESVLTNSNLVDGHICTVFDFILSLIVYLILYYNYRHLIQNMKIT